MIAAASAASRRARSSASPRVAGHHREHVVPGRERGARRRRAGGERRDPRDHPHRVPSDHALEEEAERPVEEGISLAETGDVAARVEVLADHAGRPIVDLPRREAGGDHRHPDRDLGLARALEMRRYDGPRNAFAGLRGRVGEHRGGPERPEPLHGDEVGVARADADADEGAGCVHRLRAASSVTGYAGRKARKRPSGAACDTAIRESSPPNAACASKRVRSPSRLTA